MFTDITTMHAMEEVIVEFSAYATLVLTVLLVSTVWMISLARDMFYWIKWKEFFGTNKVFLVITPVLFLGSLFLTMMMVTYVVFFL